MKIATIGYEQRRQKNENTNKSTTSSGINKSFDLGMKKNNNQIPFCGFWSFYKYTPTGMFLSAIGEGIKFAWQSLAPKVLDNLFHYKTKLAKPAEEAREKVAVDVLKDLDKRLTTIIDKNKKVTPANKIIQIYGEKLERVLLPLKGDGNEDGLNKIIGLVKLKTGFYNDVLMPLCEVMDGKSKHSFVQTGIIFFGPKGTGKTYFAEQLGEHYTKKGGYFHKINLTNDLAKDTTILDNAYSEAKRKFIESGKKKYTMIFIDEVEKYLGKDNSLQGRTAKLLELANNGKDNGAILITTANYLDKVEPALLRNGRTDLRVPIGHITEFDLADIINYYIKKGTLPVEEELDFQQIIDAVKTEKLQYKPKDIENRLNSAATDYSDYGGKLGTNELKDALTSAKPKFNNEEGIQFTKDKAYAEQQDIGGIYKY